HRVGAAASGADEREPAAGVQARAGQQGSSGRGWTGYRSDRPPVGHDRATRYAIGLAQTPGIWRALDEWLRHRLRAIQRKHWKRGTTMFRELRALGASGGVAQRVAANSRRWWRNSDGLLKTVLTIAYFDRLGVPRLL
ncbi:MAG: group II intron reverse transcriptase/maturase, partial [Betaproteobacteria bacterium]